MASQTSPLALRRVLGSALLSALLLPTAAALDSQQPVASGARIAWDQVAGSDAEIASYAFTLYVDGSPATLGDASCVRVATSYECMAQLPALSPGVHRLEVSSRFGGAESARSDAIFVTVSGSSPEEWRDIAVGGEPNWFTRPPAAANLTLEQVATGLADVTDLGFADESLLFVAERSGTVRAIREGWLLSEAVLRIDDVERSPRGGLFSLTLDPQFERTGLLYAAYASESSRGLMYHVARFRYAGGQFAEHVVLLDGVRAAPDNLSATIRFGPDGKLYVAFADADGSRDVPSSYSGKVLRLNPDATTPSDQPAASPVYVSGLTSPRGLAWERDGPDLWIIDALPQESRLLHAPASERGAISAMHVLPERAASMVLYDGDTIAALQGQMLISSDEAAQILQTRYDAMDGTMTFRMSAVPVTGPARTMAVSPSGDLYICVADALFRVSPPR